MPPSNKDAINAEPTASVTNVAPIPIAATVRGALAIARRRRDRYEPFMRLELTASVAIMTMSSTIATWTLGDLLPLLAVSVAFRAALIPQIRGVTWNSRAIMRLVVVGSMIVSLPIETALAAQYNWAFRFGISDFQPVKWRPTQRRCTRPRWDMNEARSSCAMIFPTK